MMRHIKSFLFTIFAVFLLVPMLHAGDEEDINLMVKEKVSVIFELLGQKDLDKDERNLKIVEELNEIMYFTAAGALSLGKHWKKISKKQKKEFLKIFKKYINNYISTSGRFMRF